MNDRSDDEFTAHERALLATWDRHNAPVAANDERDADFEHRLIAAYQAAREASLRVAESNDEAICRQIAADALADAGGVAGAGAAGTTAGAARLEAPATAVAISPARLAGVAFAGSALGGVMTALGIGVCGRHIAVEPSHRSTVTLVARQGEPPPMHDGADRRSPHWLVAHELGPQHASCIRPPPAAEPLAAPRNRSSPPAATAKAAPARARPPAPGAEDAAAGPDIAIQDCAYRRALAALEARSRPVAHTWAVIADGTTLISRSYAHTGPTCDRSLDAVLAEKKSLQRSGVGLR